MRKLPPGIQTIPARGGLTCVLLVSRSSCAICAFYPARSLRRFFLSAAIFPEQDEPAILTDLRHPLCQVASYLALSLDVLKLAPVDVVEVACIECAGSGADSSEANNSRKSSTNEIRTTTAEPARPIKNSATTTSMKTTPKACIRAVWRLNCQQRLRTT